MARYICKNKWTIIFIIFMLISSIFILKYFSKNNDFISEGKGLYRESVDGIAMLSDMRRGFSFKYWITNATPFYFPDRAIDGVSYVITGFANIQLAKNISRILFNLLLFLLMYFLSKKIIYKDKNEKAFINFCLKMAYLSLFVFFVTQGGDGLFFSFYLMSFVAGLLHGGTFFNVILCFYLFYVERDKIGKTRFFLNFLIFWVIFLASLSDILFILVFSIPLLVFVLFKIIIGGKTKNIFYQIEDLIVVITASFIGFSIYEKIILRKIGTSFDFVYIFRNFFVLFGNFVKTLFGFLLFSESIASRCLFFFSFLIFCFFVFFIAYLLLKKKIDFAKWGFLFFVVFSVTCNFLSGIFKGMLYVHEERYFLEFIILPLLFFPIFILQYFKKYFEKIKFKKTILIFSLLFVLIFNFSLIKNYFTTKITFSEILNNPSPQIAKIIDGYKEKYGLESGIANYWIANQISFYSQKGIFCLSRDPLAGGGETKLLNIQKVFFENAKTQEKRKYNFILVWKDVGEGAVDYSFEELLNKYIEIFGAPDIMFEDKQLNEIWGEIEILVYKHDISEKVIDYLISENTGGRNVWAEEATKFYKKIVLYPGSMTIYKGTILDQKNITTSGVEILGKQNNPIFGGGTSLYPGKYVLKIDAEAKGEVQIAVEISGLGGGKPWKKREILLAKTVAAGGKELYFNTSKLDGFININLYYEGKNASDSYKIDKLELEKVGEVNLLPIYFKYYLKEIIVFVLIMFLTMLRNVFIKKENIKMMSKYK